MLKFLTDLQPCSRISRQKSFNGKAKVFVDDNSDLCLKSDDMLVCTITENGDILIPEFHNPMAETEIHILHFINRYYSNGNHLSKVN